MATFSQDREKLVGATKSPERRQHNDAPSQKTAMLRWPRRGREKNSIASICSWIVEHQIGISLNMLGLLFFSHILFPSARHHTQKFFRISYYNPTTDKYALGWDDIFFVFYWIIAFTGLRCMVMDYVLSPLAAACGIHKKKAKVRFVEQAWIMTYDTMFWSTGMYIMYHSDYWFNLRALWRDWPTREMDALAKWYYLVQFAFWLQQIVVVHIEERRKDHWHMFSHHIVTCLLIFGSYGYHQSKVGNVILCLMDLIDIILPAAKLLKYLNYQFACDIAFGVFIVTWFITRHVLYMWVLWSIYAHIPEEIRYGCYVGSTQQLQGPLPVPNDWEHLTWPFRDPVGMVCWNDNIKLGFLALLLALQVILLMWFTMIVKIAYRVLAGQGADDVRSDDEDEEEEEEEEAVIEDEKRKLMDSVPACAESRPLIEKEVLSTEFVDNTSRSGRSPVRRGSKRRDGTGHSSGINVLGSSDRKELLGRIGCDKSSGN